MEWEKRLEEENKLKAEINENMSDDEIEKIEAKLESQTEEKYTDSSESEEEPIENDVILEDKPKKRNPMLDDEAEVSETDEVFDNNENDNDDKIEDNEDKMDDDEDMDDESGDSSDSEEEAEVENKTRKGRILKAFEDSDDEDNDKISSNTNGEIVSTLTEECKSTENHLKESQGI